MTESRVLVESAPVRGKGLVAGPSAFSPLRASSQADPEIFQTSGGEARRYAAEYWTSRQRQASPIQEISYRACFKPQLPRFFIERLTHPGDWVYDPFSGRGTTGIEAALLGRRAALNDVSPLSRVLAEGRFYPPDLDALEERLRAIPMDPEARADIDLSMFYHPRTEAEVVSLKNYLAGREKRGQSDALDLWIRTVATNRLTGHSPGFFSVYTLPPNQAASAEGQRRINALRNQTPEYRDVVRILLKKSRALLARMGQGDLDRLRRAGETALFLTEDARRTPALSDGSVNLVVTSPPFLDVVQYTQDNWLRCWFNGIDAKEVGPRVTMARKLEDWALVMGDVLKELYRVVAPGGWVAFEVGEVRGGSVRLEETVVPLGIAAGFDCPGVLVNEQFFTKTSNIWGIANNERGTNTNRVVLFQKA